MFALIGYSLLGTLLLSTTAMAMEEKDSGPGPGKHLIKASKPYPAPPEVTYQDYVSTLCFEDGKMGRWGRPKGNLAGWLQSTANKKMLEDLDGKPLEDFPLFNLTLYPVVDDPDKKVIRCDYSLPALNSDQATFSLYYDDATSEEIEAINKLKPESIPNYTTRLLEWQDMLKRKQQVTNAVVFQLLNEKFIPDLTLITDQDSCKTFSAHFQNARSDKTFLYIHFDAATMQLKTCAILASQYEPKLRGMTPDEIMTHGRIHCLRDSIPEEMSLESFDCLYEDRIGQRLNQAEPFNLKSLLLNVKGPLVIRSPAFNFENVLLWPVGNLTFQPMDQGCPLEKIKITACNSTKPICVSGYGNFNRSPTVKLELLNAAAVHLKFRERK